MVAAWLAEGCPSVDGSVDQWVTRGCLDGCPVADPMAFYRLAEDALSCVGCLLGPSRLPEGTLLG